MLFIVADWVAANCLMEHHSVLTCTCQIQRVRSDLVEVLQARCLLRKKPCMVCVAEFAACLSEELEVQWDGTIAAGNSFLSASK